MCISVCTGKKYYYYDNMMMMVGIEWLRHVAGTGEMRVAYELLKYHEKI